MVSALGCQAGKSTPQVDLMRGEGVFPPCCLLQALLWEKVIWCQVFKGLEDIPAVTHLASNLSYGESRRFGMIMSYPAAILRFCSGKSKQSDAELDL